MNRPSPSQFFGFGMKHQTVERAAESNGVDRSKIPWVLHRIAPYLGAIGALLLVATLLVTMYFTWLDWQWVTFLSGILGAAILSLASRSIHAEWLIARRTAQLSLTRQKLAAESQLRTHAEQELAAVESNIAYLHESLPAMLAFLDNDRQIKYYNRAFHHGLGATVSHLDGRHLREVVGTTIYDELEEDLSHALSGFVVHRERSHETAAGGTAHLLMQFLPQFDNTGAVAGVFLVATDLSGTSGVARPIETETGIDAATGELTPPEDGVLSVTAEHENYAARLRYALAHDEFSLFFQELEPVAAHGALAPFHEILLRMKAEEESMVPPGSFLAVAEQHGMLPDLDRWVVRHLLAWARAATPRQQAVYSINISAQTMSDPGFPAFVRKTLGDFGLHGSLLCFELQEADLLNRSVDAARFVNQLRPLGCLFTICGFDSSRISFELLRNVPVNFLKIDSKLTFNIRRSAIDLERVKSIQRVAKAIGVGTIAECVEDSKTLARLRSIGVDYAQGFGVSVPKDIGEIPLRPHHAAAGESIARHA
jgi:PAS domain S-box-containing protein